MQNIYKEIVEEIMATTKENFEAIIDDPAQDSHEKQYDQGQLKAYYNIMKIIADK